MSIFNNVKKSPISQDVDSFIRLKHGDIIADTEWLETLPPAVIQDALAKTQRYYQYNSARGIQSLAALMVTTTTQVMACDALMHSLREYYTLQI